MKYVLLLSGGVNDRYNYDRYASDLAFARQVMDEYLGTTEKIVQILYADVLTANQPGYPSYTRIYPEMITYQGININMIMMNFYIISLRLYTAVTHQENLWKKILIKNIHLQMHMNMPGSMMYGIHYIRIMKRSAR